VHEADIKGGRPSIAPEKRMRDGLLQVQCSLRSERQSVAQIQYNLLFRCCVDLALGDPVWNHAVTELFNATVEMAHTRGLLSGEHASVHGTLVQAWASRAMGCLGSLSRQARPV
jgi:transposase